MFLDETTLKITSGSGGNGAVSYRREKFVPKGGPDGGDGGQGGNIIFESSNQLHTLFDLNYKVSIKADNGGDGKGNHSTGKNGKNVIIKVPLGTLIKDKLTNKLLGDLSKNSDQFIAASGGRGGKGNARFKTPTNQCPRYATQGVPGQTKIIHLELKLIADCGLVGFPNAGKSSLIRKLSSATPKVANFEFTTLKPNLGVVSCNSSTSFVLADIPGLIEGAASGKGLGNQFLKHIERTRCLAFVIDGANEKCWQNLEVLQKELKMYNPSLLKKPKLLLVNKSDLSTPPVPDFVRSIFPKIIKTSAVDGTGLKLFKNNILRLLLDERTEVKA